MYSQSPLDTTASARARISSLYSQFLGAQNEQEQYRLLAEALDLAHHVNMYSDQRFRQCRVRSDLYTELASGRFFMNVRGPPTVVGDAGPYIREMDPKTLNLGVFKEYYKDPSTATQNSISHRAAQRYEVNRNEWIKANNRF